MKWHDFCSQRICKRAQQFASLNVQINHLRILLRPENLVKNVASDAAGLGEAWESASLKHQVVLNHSPHFEYQSPSWLPIDIGLEMSFWKLAARNRLPIAICVYLRLSSS